MPQFPPVGYLLRSGSRGHRGFEGGGADEMQGVPHTPHGLLAHRTQRGNQPGRGSSTGLGQTADDSRRQLLVTSRQFQLCDQLTLIHAADDRAAGDRTPPSDT